MSSFNQPRLTQDIAHVLGAVRRKGVRLWSANGQLHFKGPKGALTQRELEALRLAKRQLVAFLEQATPAAEGGAWAGHAGADHRFPLTYSQLAYWNLYQLGERRSLRSVASATRIRGPLDVDTFQSVIPQIVRRHEALRTRIIEVDGSPVQQVAPDGYCALRVENLAAIAETFREAEIHRVLEQLVLEPVDVSVDPLCALALLRFGHNEHVLLVAMEHMISDAVSMSILLREIFTAYMQSVRGQEISLPAISVQPGDYALLQTNAREAWWQAHGRYWSERLQACERVRFPPDDSSSGTARPGWGTVNVRIDRQLKSQLQAWCRKWHTTLAMCVFTAYVALVMRWCNVTDLVIPYQVDGRANGEVDNTIGYFASTLFLRVESRTGDSFLDLLKRVTAEYCNGYEHADYSYLEAQAPYPEIARNPAFNWIPLRPSAAFSDLDGTEHAISCSAVPFLHPLRKVLERDGEPLTVLHDTQDEVLGSITYPLNRFSGHTMERFGCNFRTMLESLLSSPHMRAKDVVLS